MMFVNQEKYLNLRDGNSKMRLYQHINEVLKIDKKLVKKVINTKTEVEYESVNYIGEKDSRATVWINFQPEYRHEVPWNWEIDFGIVNKGREFFSRFPTTSVKETIQILNVVVSAVDDFLRTKKPEKFQFYEATGLKGGFKLYKQFAKHIVNKYPYELSVFGKEFKFERTE